MQILIEKQCEPEVQKIIHLQDLVDKLPDTFTDPKDVTKSHITAAMLQSNWCPRRISLKDQIILQISLKQRMKRDKPVSSKDKERMKRGKPILEKKRSKYTDG